MSNKLFFVLFNSVNKMSSAGKCRIVLEKSRKKCYNKMVYTLSDKRRIIYVKIFYGRRNSWKMPYGNS